MNFIKTSMKFFILFLLPLQLSAQISSMQLSTPINSDNSGDDESTASIFATQSQWQEVVSARTVNSRTFIMPDGRTIIHNSQKPLNFYDLSGELVPIDHMLKLNSDGKGWSAMQQPHPVFVYADGSFALSMDHDQLCSFGKNCSVNGSWNYGNNNITVDNDNMITMHDVVPGVNKVMDVRENSVKYNYVIDHALNLTSAYFTASEELNLPAGYSIRRDNSEGREENGGWSGDFEILNSYDEVNGKIFAPIIFDAAKNWTLGSYIIDNTKGHIVLKLVVPNSWLNDPSRVYPVTIDPLVTGPLSLWSGGTMPSCLTPANNADSILVTIPAQIAITKFYVTASFYADPFSPAIMADGAMWFSTQCNTSVTYTLSPAQGGNLPGTAYLDTADLRSQVLCCFAQSCTQRTFWFTMHLQRSQWGSGCNTTYIRYDPLTTSWPFEAYIVGHTVEYYGQGFTVQATPICSRQCTFNANVFIKYGVPPYTITHPWMASPIVVGTPNGCSFSPTNQQLVLTIPNCPDFCDTTTQLIVGPPIVTDACGNTVAGLLQRILTIKPTPTLTISPNPDSICSGAAYNINATPCFNNATVTWTDGTNSGTGNMTGVGINNGTSDATTTFTSFASLNGCNSDTVNSTLIVHPEPTAAFSVVPNPAYAGVPANFSDISSLYAGTNFANAWNFGNASTGTGQNPTHTYPSPGIYTVCMEVVTSNGCIDSTCQDIEVIPAEVEPINVVTPNGDNVNDVLAFKYLEDYPNNHLDLYDRWGVMIYSKDGYTNDWNGSKYSDGTYYFVLQVKDTQKTYKGFFEIIK